VIFGFLSPDNINALADRLAHRVATRYPPVIANAPEQTVSQRRVEEILEEVFSIEFGSGSYLGILGKMRLAHAVRRKLREIGYDEKFVDSIITKLGERPTPRTG
jgi:hypothetical protein